MIDTFRREGRSLLGFPEKKTVGPRKGRTLTYAHLFLVKLKTSLLRSQSVQHSWMSLLPAPDHLDSLLFPIFLGSSKNEDDTEETDHRGSSAPHALMGPDHSVQRWPGGRTACTYCNLRHVGPLQHSRKLNPELIVFMTFGICWCALPENLPA